MITNLVRDWGVQPAIVRLYTTDTLSAVSAAGYLTAQNANILAINSGTFDWDPTDFVLVCSINTAVNPNTYSWGQFTISSDFTSLIPFGVQSALVTLNQAQVQGAYATPVLLVGAPQTGYGLIVNNPVVITEASTAFSGGGVGVVQYGNTVHGAGTNALSATIPAAEITASTSQVYSMSGYTATTVTDTSVITGLGLYFSNQTAAFAGGAGSTVTLAFSYRVLPIV